MTAPGVEPQDLEGVEPPSPSVLRPPETVGRGDRIGPSAGSERADDHPRQLEDP